MVSLAGIPAMIPSLVGESTTTANALEILSYTIDGIAGPALAGVPDRADRLASDRARRCRLLSPVSRLAHSRRPAGATGGTSSGEGIQGLSAAIALLVGNPVLARHHGPCSSGQHRHGG